MKTNQILQILKVASWIIFIGLCIKTGALIISFLVSLFGNPEGAKNLYIGLNLSELLAFDLWHYIVMGILTILIPGLKAYLFYKVITIITKINISNPFSKEIANLISEMSGIALQIGITALITTSYAKWLMRNEIYLALDGIGTEFLFLAGILFVIAVIFKKGIEIQSENELTI